MKITRDNLFEKIGRALLAENTEGAFAYYTIRVQIHEDNQYRTQFENALNNRLTESLLGNINNDQVTQRFSQATLSCTLEIIEPYETEQIVVEQSIFKSKCQIQIFVDDPEDPNNLLEQLQLPLVNEFVVGRYAPGNDAEIQLCSPKVEKRYHRNPKMKTSIESISRHAFSLIRLDDSRWICQAGRQGELMQILRKADGKRIEPLRYPHRSYWYELGDSIIVFGPDKYSDQEFFIQIVRETEDQT